MNRRSLALSAGGVVLAAASVTAAGVTATRAEEPRNHKIAIHVGGADSVLMSTALHNIAAAADYYAEKGEQVSIELVANGLGYTMVRADTSPVKALFAATHRKYPSVVFSACQNSRRAIAASEGKAMQDIPELEGVTDVPAGIVRLNELQEQDFSYVRA